MSKLLTSLFLAASMTLEMANTDKVAEFRREALRMGIAVELPSVNGSGVTFSVKDGRIQYSLAADREDEEHNRDRDSDRGGDPHRAVPPRHRHVPRVRDRTRTRDGRVGDHGHARSIVRRHGEGHPRGSRATLAHGPDRRADPRAKIPG